MFTTRHTVFHKNDSPKSFLPPQVAKAYSFPPGTGKGQTIALIELGGGYQESDLAAYWQEVGVSTVSVIPVTVDGVSNQPTGDADGPDGEVALDIQVLGSIAPGAVIKVYFAPNTDQGFLDAITQAITDRVNIISISWGGPESSWQDADLNAFEAAFQQAATLGITVTAAAGDNGADDGTSTAEVDFPSSSPYVLGCGGTRLEASRGKISSEVVWSTNGATGGGISQHFPKPAYQVPLHTPGNGRSVPDVAGNADPETGYEIIVDGKHVVIGGTSAVAPLWAALIALINENVGQSVGFFHPLLYSHPKDFRDITQGSNGLYAAKPGFDNCTGLGTPNGELLLEIFQPGAHPSMFGKLLHAVEGIALLPVALVDGLKEK